MPRAVSKCPQCREPVSPFAAGCAICGTDLVAARADLAERRAKRPHLPSAPRLDDDALRIFVAVLSVVFAPLMGALLSGWFAYDADRNGRTRTRNLMILLLGFSVIGLIAYRQIWGWVFLGI